MEFQTRSILKRVCLCLLWIVMDIVCSANSPTVERWRNGIKTDFFTIQSAINSSKAGDVIKIRGGVYYENLIIEKVHGEAGRPIRLLGAEGEQVIIEGALKELQRPGNGKWIKSKSGEYHVNLNNAFFNAKWDRIGAVSIGNDDSLIATYWKEENFENLSRGRGVIKRGQTVSIHLEGDVDPNELSIHIGRAPSNILIRNASFWEISNLELRHAGFSAIYLEGGAYHHLTFDSLRIHTSFRGISSEEDHGGHDLRIQHCTFSNKMPRNWTWDGYEDGESASDDSKAPQRTTGIMLKAVQHVEIKNCHLQGWWDGMKLTGSNIEAHHNIIHDILDDMVELESNYSNDVRFHHNYGYDLFVGVSLVKNIGGNLYIYRNKIISDRKMYDRKKDQFYYGYCIKLGKAWGTEKLAENVKVFNNSFYAVRACFWDARTATLSGFEFINNIFYSEQMPFLNKDTLTHNFANGCFWSHNLWSKPLALRESGIQVCDPLFSPLKRFEKFSLILQISKGSCAQENGCNYPSTKWPGIDDTLIFGKVDIGADEIPER